MSTELEIRDELFRVLKDVIERGVRGKDYEIMTFAGEYPVNGEKADLVVFWKNVSSGEENPFLVIETKARARDPSKSLPDAVEQAMTYANSLGSRFFAVYDAWNFLLFKTTTPYLIKLGNFHKMDVSICKNLLEGLLEKARYPYESKKLDLLPKVADGWSFWETIIPSIAKSLASITTPEQEEAWEVLKDQWFPIIKRDGEW